MPTLDSEISIVEALRSKTEDADVKQFLKSTMGGYTKSSVLEYLTLLRRQQQSMADTFSHNQQLLFDEKENLKKANDALKTRLVQIEAQYQELSSSLRLHELEDEEMSPQDIVALKNKITALEDEQNKGEIEKSRLEKQIEQRDSIIDDFTFKFKQAEQEKQSIREILKAEMTKSKNLNTVVSRLSGTIEEKDEEIKFLNALVCEGQLAKLTEKVNELTEQLLSQAELMAAYNRESDLKAQTIETLNSEKNDISARNAELSRNIDELNEQNGKQLAASKALTEQLENEYKKSIALIKEKSSITMDKLSAAGKLDEANSKIMMLELRLKKLSDSESSETMYVRSNETGETVPVNF